jgi:hypothetical protein
MPLRFNAGLPMPYGVVLPRARRGEIRRGRIAWCQANVGREPSGILWIPPRAEPRSDWEDDEEWRFLRESDAVLFAMVWDA